MPTLADWQRRREEEEARKRAEAAAQEEKGGSGKKMKQKRIVGESQSLLDEKRSVYTPSQKLEEEETNWLKKLSPVYQYEKRKEEKLKAQQAASQQARDDFRAGEWEYAVSQAENVSTSTYVKQKTRQEKAWNWAFNNQVELSLGTGIVAGLAAAVIVATAAITAPAWVIVGGAVLATAAIITLGTVAINSHYGLNLGNNLATNLIVGTAATLITAGVGIWLTNLAPIISTTITTTCTQYATACTQIGTIISSSRKGLNMVNLVPTKETDNHVQTYKQDYPNNPFRASPKGFCGIGG